MSDLRPKGTMITLGDKEYGLLFSINAIDDIQDHFDIAISELGELFKDEKKQIKNLRYIITVLVNEYIDLKNDENNASEPHLEERYVGRHIDMTNINNLVSAIYGSFSAGAIEVGEDEVESPNALSE